MSRRRLLSALPLVFALSAPGLAGPTDPVVVTRPSDADGEAFVPLIRTLEDLPVRYVEEEFLVAGTATLYSYASDPPSGPTDVVSVETGIPWKTRILVRRPKRPKHFRGRVVIEWLNSSAGFDSAPSWDPSAEYFARGGWIYVGVTNSSTSIDFLADGCSLFGVLPPTCGTRYADLSLPENGLAYEVVSQIAHLLKSDDPDNPIPPKYRVKRLYHTGQSQQGGSIITYASAFHLPGVNDGYFVQANVGARPINFGPACGDEGSPPFPDCTPRLEGADRLVRTDLPVPVVQAVGETDVALLFGIAGRQPDTPTFRYYELAGVAHLTVHAGIEIVPGTEPLLLEDLCAHPLNSSADGPVHGSYLVNALWENLDRQVSRGDVPPPGRVMEVDAGGVIQRDEFDNALGGLRVPEMDVPTGSHFPPTNEGNPDLPDFLRGIGDLACRLGGSTTPFDADALRTLYPTRRSYKKAVVRAAKELLRERLLLKADKRIIKRRARASGIGGDR